MSSHAKTEPLEGTHSHFQHDHHPGGQPPTTSARPGLASKFPSEVWGFSGLENDDFGTRGFGLGFTHVTCPYTDPKGCFCGRLFCHLDSLIIAVDGACPNNGAGAVTSACGVYFGEQSPNNKCWRVPDHPLYPHTSQRAELHAALGALRAAEPYVVGGGQWDCNPDQCKTPCRVEHLIIKSDSAYLVNSITDYIEKWMTNGWQTANKTAVKNQDLWEEMVRLIRLIKAKGACVDFWLVKRDMNEEADRLANQGLLRP